VNFNFYDDVCEMFDKSKETLKIVEVDSIKKQLDMSVFHLPAPEEDEDPF
jgi:hypothetical protein